MARAIEMAASAVPSKHFDESASLADECQVHSYSIGIEMQKAGLPDSFIVAAVTTASEYEGVFELLQMWSAESDQAERDAIVYDLQERIDDCAQPEKVEGIVRFDDLDQIAADIRKFKVQIAAELG
jgi:hypothetical protein